VVARRKPSERSRRLAWRASALCALKVREFITPYTPEQNGLVERFFRSLKEECVWLHNFDSFTEARTAINKGIQCYNAGRPHQSLGYRSPRQFRALHLQLVA
jgi:putative transposase